MSQAAASVVDGRTAGHRPSYGILGDRPSVLVIDDDPDVLALLDVTLDRAGYRVLGHPDGPSALAAAVALRPDAVVIDWVLPGCSGLELCTGMRARPELAATAIVILSARGHHRDVEIGYVAGADRYVVKPVRPPAMVALMRDVLHG